MSRVVIVLTWRVCKGYIWHKSNRLEHKRGSRGGVRQSKTFSLQPVPHCFCFISQMAENLLIQQTFVSLKELQRERETLSFIVIIAVSSRSHKKLWIYVDVTTEFSSCQFCLMWQLCDIVESCNPKASWLHVDVLLLRRFSHRPAELWEWTRWSPPTNHLLTYGSGERWVLRSEVLFVCVPINMSKRNK